MKFLARIVLILPLIAVSVTAADDSEKSRLKTPEELLVESMAILSPGTPIDSVLESVIPGVYELTSGARIFYFTANGRYMIDGEVLDLQDRVNLTEEKRAELQMQSLSSIPEDQMIVFNNKQGDAERYMTVFTDSDCGFCQKLHQEIETITDADIRVRYILYPRAGIASASGMELESVWCAEDQQAAMTLAKSGGEVPKANCVNPLERHIALGQEVDLRGTPLIFLDSGQKIGGYQPAAQLIAQIKNSKQLELPN